MPALFAMLAAAPYFGRLWLMEAEQRLSREQKGLEVQLRQLQKDNDRRRQAYAALITSENLEKRVRELALGLVAPQPNSIMRLYEVVDLADPSSARYYAEMPVDRSRMLASAQARE